MQGIYTRIPETNYVPREYCIAAILLFLFMVLISLVSVLLLLLFLLLLLLLLYCTQKQSVRRKSYTEDVNALWSQYKLSSVKPGGACSYQ